LQREGARKTGKRANDPSRGERDATRRHALLSRAQVLAVLGPLLISLEGVDPVVAKSADLYNLGVHDVARALLALPDDSKSPLESS
jgi:hypothetical protein